MHYNINCEITPEVSRLFTKAILELYDKYKDNEKIFPKEDKATKL